MHTEYVSVRRDTIRKLIAHDGCAIAVGTTSVRTLESLYYMGLKVIKNPDASEDELHVNQWEPYDTETTVSTVESLTALGDWMDSHKLEVLHSSTQINCPRLRVSHRKDVGNKLPSASVYTAAIGKCFR